MAKTGKPCQICSHERRHVIEVALTYKTPLRVLATRFNVSADALWRHSRRHLPVSVKAAILTAAKPIDVDLGKLQVSESEGLLGALVVQRARLQTFSELALELHDVKAAVSVENAITGNLSLVAKLLGQLVQRHEVRHTSILISADYLQLRGAIVRALVPFPQAARAVGEALHQLEAQAAKDITARAGKGKAPLLIEAMPT